VRVPTPNLTPAPETTAVEGLGPKRPAAPAALGTPPDGADVSELSRAVAAALGANEQKVESLRQAAASGSYVVDPIKVIEKMLPIENPE
jgi:Anti-sigma-28 factor, FlgM